MRVCLWRLAAGGQGVAPRKQGPEVPYGEGEQGQPEAAGARAGCRKEELLGSSWPSCVSLRQQKPQDTWGREPPPR